MVSALEIAEGSIALLEKAAQEADALEAQVLGLEADVRQLRKELQLSKSAAGPKMDHQLLLKVAEVLESQHMLAEGYTAEKLASMYAENPNMLADITLRLLCPMATDGRPVGKQASENSPGGVKTVRFNGQEFVDHENWLGALK